MAIERCTRFGAVAGGEELVEHATDGGMVLRRREKYEEAAATGTGEGGTEASEKREGKGREKQMTEQRRSIDCVNKMANTHAE